LMYRRTFDADAQDSLAKLSRWLQAGTTVLELGPAAGYFTRHLRAIGCTVDVVEIDPEAANEVSDAARNVVVGDLALATTLDRLADQRYDTIVCADVLEHVVDGKALLVRLRALLAPQGQLLLSVRLWPRGHPRSEPCSLLHPPIACRAA
jgi:2-polyprenyl-3-methyl-5-hydroxy-6-metoxy-1,4-benzoquinol methylase